VPRAPNLVAPSDHRADRCVRAPPPTSPLGLPRAGNCPEEDALKGDKVEIVVDASGDTRTYEVEATRAGRRVDVTHGRGLVEVTEVTRGGTPVRTARFMAARVIALVEHPSPRAGAEDDDETVRPLRVSA
jgi:hypothetical protein